MTAPTAGCSTLVPEGWKAGIASADFPTQPELSADPAMAWRTFGVRQTGQLDKANTRTTDAISIVQNCEKRDLAAVVHLTRKWWEFWK